MADVGEWYDDDSERFRIEVNVANTTWGPLFGYRGAFGVEWRDVHPGESPASLRPRREERRE